MENKIMVIHHNDMDGYSAARVVYEFLRHSDYEVEFVEGNYSPTSPHLEALKSVGDYKMVYIVDFSIAPEHMVEVIDIIGIQNVVWLDHHWTSIVKYTKENIDISMIPGIRVGCGLCGTELAYLYLFKNFTQPSPDKNIIITQKGEIEFDLSKTEDEDKVLDNYMPKVLRMVGDWDTFRHKRLPEEQQATAPNFNLGFTMDERHKDPTNDDFYEDYLETETLFGHVVVPTEVKNCLVAGEVITKYLAGKNKADVMRNAFPVSIANEGFKDVKCIALDTTFHSSKVFDSVFDDYEVAIVFHYLGKGNVIYSFYRLGLNPEKNINCGEIAQKFNGGGHPGAAGATVPASVDVFFEIDERTGHEAKFGLYM